MENSMVETNLPASDQVRIQMVDIWKRFPGIIANQGINLDLKAGEIHALLGENGAGKSTLMNILSGIYRPDAGKILIDGEKVDFRSPKQAAERGIGMVHQHFKLVDNFTVAENVCLGWDIAPWHTSRKRLAGRLKLIGDELGFSFDPQSEIWQLPVGEQQRAEILHVLAKGVSVLIMDEPTSVLTPLETKELFAAMRSMVARGQTVVFISHKLSEVLEVSDRVTVLRKGQNIATRLTSDCDHQILAELMVAKRMKFRQQQKRESRSPIIVKIRDIEALNDRGLLALKNIDLDIRQGEILGIAGVSGNGQKELAEVLTGLRPTQQGSIHINGSDLTGCSPSEFAQAGVGYVPGDRADMGLFSWETIMHNAILREYRDTPIRRGARLDWKAAERYTKELIQKADVKAYYKAPVGILSGGNQQKLLVNREIDLATSFLVAVYPTRGLDVAATDSVREDLVNHKDRGCGVIMVSEDLDEILLMSDRIAVMFEGRVMAIFSSQEASYEKIGLLMGGEVLEVTADD
jgi:simple sugar transport system ATP-binding protein